MTNQASSVMEKYNVLSVTVKGTLFQTNLDGGSYVKAVRGLGRRVIIQAISADDFVVASASKSFRTFKARDEYFAALKVAA